MKEARPRRPYIVGLHLYEMSGMSKSTEMESSLVIARGCGGAGQWGVCTDGYLVSFWGDENDLGLDSGDGCRSL